MKILAMYLPQFHKVKENDEWWGKGFTDWIPTKNAKPLREGHYQPHVPLNNNYYDLLNKDTVKWQAELMHQYGVDGMCIYHYYFKDGRKILEKPAEKLLEWKDVDMPFCFYWANESWKRSWSNVPNANVWQSDSGKPESIQDTGLLLDQQYGDESAWEDHFNYLLPFLRDERYIRIDGKPLIIIYRSALIPCLNSMLECWRNMAETEGLGGLYVIGAYANDSAKEALDGVLYHEPPQTLVALREGGIGNDAYSITYDTIVNHVLNEPMIDKKTYFSCFTGFDDTPRRGSRGNALIEATAEKYQDFLARTIAKNCAAGSEVTFINAWNEWGEGMHLEPDEKNGYAYLEATLRAREIYEKYVEEYKQQLSNNTSSNYVFMQNKADKFEQYMRLLDRWMEMRELNINVADYFKERNLCNVAIYGFGNFGKHLLWELEKSEINVKYIIDRQGKQLYSELPIYLPEENLPDCDVIVVTPFWIYSDICNVLPKDKVLVPLDEIINSFQNR